LKLRGESLVTVELGRSAMLATWFASLGETSAYRGGFCFATLGELAAVFGVSDDRAIETLRQRSGADWLLLVDQYPSLECEDDAPLPAANVTFCVVGPNGERHQISSRLGGHPSIIYSRIGKAALAWLRRVLAEQSMPTESTTAATQ